MFWNGKKGYEYQVINTSQFFYIVIVAYFGLKLGMIMVDDMIGMAVGGVGYILGFITFFFTMPSLLDSYVLLSSVEMIRDRKAIENVLKEMKYAKAQNSFKVYQILKLIRREMVLEIGAKKQSEITYEDSKPEVHDHIVQSFLALNSKGRLSIDNDQIFSLIRLSSGSKYVNREETFQLMKKIHV